MEAKASAKYLRGSAQKARLVVDMIRGKNLGQALAILQFTNKRAADGIEKCVRSAWANVNEAAEKANVAVDPDELFIKAAFVDQGPTKNRRRVRPAPQGRAYREQRHFCHITVLLSTDGKEPVVGARAKNAPDKKRGTTSATTKSPSSAAKTKSKDASKTKAASTETAQE
ncbi:MAG: 50S ribosomal protein L22 [Pyrinomonadaceae bacterium]